MHNLQIQSGVETTSATKIDGGDGAPAPVVAAEITTSSQETQATAEKAADTESTPQAVDQQSSVMEAPQATDSPVVQIEVPSEPPKSDPPSIKPEQATAAAAVAPTPVPEVSQVSETANQDEAAAISSEVQTSPPLPEVKVDDVVPQEAAAAAADVADRITDEATTEGIKLAADIISSNPLTTGDMTAEPAASTPEPIADSTPAPEPTADPIPAEPTSESKTGEPAAPSQEQPKTEEVKQEEQVVEPLATKSAEQVEDDRKLLIESSASAAETNAILSAKEPETLAKDSAVEVAQPITEETIPTVTEPEKAAKSAEEQAAERQNLIDSAATTAVTNEIMSQASQESTVVTEPKPEALQADGEKKEADSTPVDDVPKADMPSETSVTKSESVVAPVVEADVPSSEVKVNEESVEPIHENNNAKGEPESVAAAIQVPAAES